MFRPQISEPPPAAVEALRARRGDLETGNLHAISVCLCVCVCKWSLEYCVRAVEIPKHVKNSQSDYVFFVFTMCV